MNRERLETLATFLENADFPSFKFNLGFWHADYANAYTSYYDHPNYPEEDANKWKEMANTDVPAPAYDIGEPFESKLLDYGVRVYPVSPKTCKTAGCAIGWAATIPEFNDAGFILAKLEYKPYFGYQGVTEHGEACVVYAKDDEIETEMEAVSEFFDISLYTANLLFLYDSYPDTKKTTEKDVAARIRRLLGTGEFKDDFTVV